MNTETREIRDVADLTEAEKASGKWIPVRRKWADKVYVQKQPITDEDYRRILAAEERRLLRRAKRLRAARLSATSAPTEKGNAEA